MDPPEQSRLKLNAQVMPPLSPLARRDFRTRGMMKYSIIEPMSSPEKESLEPGGILEKVFDIPVLDRITNPRGKDFYFGIVRRKEID